MFKVEIATDNAAFVGDDDGADAGLQTSDELAFIMREIADSLEAGCLDFDDRQSVRDSNGNRVGHYILTRS
jgi:hypothetical protein